MVAGSLTETLRDAVSLSMATDFVPSRPHVATLHRWAIKGTRGVKLQTWMVGGVRMTTPDAIERFLVELNRGAEPATDDAAVTRRAREAGAALAALGG